MNWKLVIVLVIGGAVLMHSLIYDGVFSGMMLFGLMLAGFGAGTILKKRRGKHADSDEQEIW